MNQFAADAADGLSAISEAFPLTAAQSDIWLDQLRQGDSPLYNIGGYVELTGPLDPALMQAALEGLVARHDAMRTILLPGAGQHGLPLQRFAQSLPAPMPIHDVCAQPDPQSAARRLIQERIEQPFTLDGGPLFRFLLIRLDADHHWLSILAHHLIVDGWGFGEMLKSLDELYNALAQGRQPPDSAPSYIDFINDDARYYQSHVMPTTGPIGWTSTATFPSRYCCPGIRSASPVPWPRPGFSLRPFPHDCTNA